MITIPAVIIDDIVQAPEGVPDDMTSRVFNGSEWIIYQGDEPQEAQ